MRRGDTMINRVKIENVATYTNPVDITLKDINFIYGGNGTGKTTFTKIISGELMAPLCIVENPTANNERLLVYNKSFVDENFREVGDISGIFTLGRDAGELIEYIKQKEAEHVQYNVTVQQRKEQIKKIENECQDIDLIFQNKIWSTQLKYGAIFPQAMTGTRGSKLAFKKKCLEVFEHFDPETVKPQKEIESLYRAAFAKELPTYTLYNLLDIHAVTAVDSHELLQKRITGKADSDIGRFIEYLGSSDWVKMSLPLLEKAEGKCPYCAQPLPSNIKADIEEFFDEAYQRDCDELERFILKYHRFHSETIEQLKILLANPYEILKYVELKEVIQHYTACVEKNYAFLMQKKSEPSKTVTIDSTIEFWAKINKILSGYNQEIAKHNTWIEHQKETRERCCDDVWNLIIGELNSEIIAFNKFMNGKKKAIEKFAGEKTEAERLANELEEEIKEKRASISSVEHTVLSINRILAGYGFTGFQLAENKAAKGTYKIVRPDGTDAKASLSEGEYNFITFLYFYHLIFGSTNPDDIQKNKVIVIDDPISSLDSNVLFIVSSLVKSIIQFCRNGEQSVKQVIVSTHNIYFHKEITFVGGRDHWPETRTGFYIIRKKDNISSITQYSENQIQSSYEMLWSDIRNPANGSAKTVFNTMRRILENYFNIIGGIDYEACVNQFEGEDKVICKSLISCINEQSHTISDDYFMCVEDSEIEQYLRIFSEIFEKMGHISHYNMMMRI